MSLLPNLSGAPIGSKQGNVPGKASKNEYVYIVKVGVHRVRIGYGRGTPLPFTFQTTMTLHRKLVKAGKDARHEDTLQAPVTFNPETAAANGVQPGDPDIWYCWKRFMEVYQQRYQNNRKNNLATVDLRITDTKDVSNSESVNAALSASPGIDVDKYAKLAQDAMMQEVKAFHIKLQMFNSILKERQLGLMYMQQLTEGGEEGIVQFEIVPRLRREQPV